MAEADGVCGAGGRISCPERLRTKGGLLTFVYWFEMSRNMNRKMIEDALFPGCPIRNVLARISDKWSLLVIYTLDKAWQEAIAACVPGKFLELNRKAFEKGLEIGRSQRQ